MQGQDRKSDGGSDHPMLRERELAERWRLSRRTLQRWRAEGYGPRYHLIGGAIRYRLDQVLAFEDGMMRGGDQG